MTTVAIHFCSNCNNILYPQGRILSAKEDGLGTLNYKCNICGMVEQAETTSKDAYKICVDTNYEEERDIQIDPLIIHDPTYLRKKGVECENCDNDEVIMYHHHLQGIIQSKVTFVYLCTNPKCLNHWVHSNEGEYPEGISDTDDSK
ncbi:unnamed protein product [Moneuplotes crassus]|uniref:DNA-directed RNA polymerase subunit n=1 Tax=Euplotes crassus TaxID=5936 RepID=A0AAD2D8L5_EUPCR|nr:unnamed protein product [Moneuplotes crassus]